MPRRASSSSCSKLDPLIGPDAFVQTTAGCLGQMGMNEAGITVGINNLTAMGRPGVTWPFVVRKALEQTDLDAAIEVVVGADVAGGHNYFVMGPEGEGATVEAMPPSKRVTRTNGSPLVHANNCLYPETMAEEGPRNPEWRANSEERLRLGIEARRRPRGVLRQPDDLPARRRHGGGGHLWGGDRRARQEEDEGGLGGAWRPPVGNLPALSLEIVNLDAGDGGGSGADRAPLVPDGQS